LNEFRNVELCTIGNGMAVEQFDAAMRKVLDNIDDPNTEAEATRKITMTFELTPSQQRDQINITIDTSFKAAPMRGGQINGFLRSDGKKLVAIEPNFHERSLFDETPNGKVTSIDHKSRAAGDQEND
jgi:hypothetical protein